MNGTSPGKPIDLMDSDGKDHGFHLETITFIHCPLARLLGRLV
jgi:hypothetical protein